MISASEALNMSNAEKRLAIEKLSTERFDLAVQKNELSKQLAGLGLSATQKYNKSKTVSDDVWEKRKSMAGEYARIEKRLAEIKGDLRVLSEKEGVAILKEIIRESFGEDFRCKIFGEMSRRSQGFDPIRVDPPAQTKSKSYKKELLEAYDLLLTARKRINAYIDQNEPEINKADYYTKVAGLSKCLPTIQELNKQLNLLNRIQITA